MVAMSKNHLFPEQHVQRERIQDSALPSRITQTEQRNDQLQSKKDAVLFVKTNCEHWCHKLMAYRMLRACLEPMHESRVETCTRVNSWQTARVLQRGDWLKMFPRAGVVGTPALPLVASGWPGTNSTDKKSNKTDRRAAGRSMLTLHLRGFGVVPGDPGHVPEPRPFGASCSETRPKRIKKVNQRLPRRGVFSRGRRFTNGLGTNLHEL